MIFQIAKKGDLSGLFIVDIIEHAPLIDFLNEKTNKRKILICPTDAIDIENKEITKRCIDCGLCWANNKQKVSKINNNPDFDAFKKFILNNKMFFYKWFSLILKEYSGIEVKSSGYSRTKRIPLIIKKNSILYIVKAIREDADIQKAEYELDDCINLMKDETKDYKTVKIIIVLSDYENHLEENERIILGLKKIYNKLIKMGKLNIEEVIK